MNLEEIRKKVQNKNEPKQFESNSNQKVEEPKYQVASGTEKDYTIVDSGLLSKIMKQFTGKTKPSGEPKPVLKETYHLEPEPVQKKNLNLDSIKQKVQNLSNQKKQQTLYEKAIEKELVRSGSLDSQILKRQIQKEPDILEKYINSTPSLKETKQQNATKQKQQFIQEYAERSGFLEKPNSI